MRLEKPICAPHRLSEVSPAFFVCTFYCPKQEGHFMRWVSGLYSLKKLVYLKKKKVSYNNDGVLEHHFSTESWTRIAKSEERSKRG